MPPWKLNVGMWYWVELNGKTHRARLLAYDIENTRCRCAFDVSYFGCLVFDVKDIVGPVAQCDLPREPRTWCKWLVELWASVDWPSVAMWIAYGCLIYKGMQG